MLHSTALSGYHLELFDAVTLDDNLNAHRINRDISKKNAVYTSVGKFQLSMAVIEGSQKDWNVEHLPCNWQNNYCWLNYNVNQWHNNYTYGLNGL